MSTEGRLASRARAVLDVVTRLGTADCTLVAQNLRMSRTVASTALAKLLTNGYLRAAGSRPDSLSPRHKALRIYAATGKKPMPEVRADKHGAWGAAPQRSRRAGSGKIAGPCYARGLLWPARARGAR